MDYTGFIGYKVKDVCRYLDENNVEYKIREIWDTKKTKIGDDLRIVKIINGDIVVLISAFF